MLTGSFTNAARRLGITQPAVSKLISDLEAYFGVCLFERSNMRLEPTEVARQIMEDFEKVHTSFQRFVDAANIAAKQKMDTIKLGVLPLYADTIAPILLTELQKKIPNVFYILEVLPHSALMKTLLTGEIDFALTTLPTGGSVAEHFLFVESIAAVVPADHWLSERSDISLDDLRNEAMVTLPFSSPFQQMIEEYFLAKSFEPVRVMQARTHAAIISLIRQGVGVSILGSTMTRFARDEVHFLPLKDSVQQRCGIAVSPVFQKESILKGLVSIAEDITSDVMSSIPHKSNLHRELDN